MRNLGEAVAVRIGRREKSLIFGAFVVLMLGACSGPLNLSVADIDDTTGTKFDKLPTIGKALAYADGVRSAYRSRISNQILLRKGVGLGAIAALGGLGFIVTHGGSADLAYGLGAAAGGGLATTQFFTSDREQFLYAAGSVTIGCAINAVAPLQSASATQDTLEKHILPPSSSLTDAINNVDGLISAVSEAEGGTSTNLARSRAAIAKAREVMASGQTALLRLDTAGAELVRVVDEVQDQVTKEVIANQIDLGAFIASLSATLTAHVPTPKTTAAAPLFAETNNVAQILDNSRTNGDETSQEQLQKQLQKQTNELIKKTSELESAADFVEAAGASVSLSDCTFDPDAVGGNFKLDPPTPQSVDSTVQDQTVNFALSGGRPPYRFNWLGAAPPADVKPDLESGLGNLAILVPEGTLSGTFAFRVGDVGTGVAFSQLIVQGPSAATLTRDQDDGPSNGSDEK